MALPRIDRPGDSSSPDRAGPSSPVPGSKAGLLAPLPARGLGPEPSLAASQRTAASSTASPSRGAAGLRASQRSAASRVNCGFRKPSQSDVAQRLHAQLLDVLRTEWRTIKSTNLGVLSGTAVVEELLLQRISAAAAELHTLCITHETAAERLGELCRAMEARELQQLQVMFDHTGHSELSDFVRLMVYNTSDPSVKHVVGDLSALKAATSGRRARSSSSTRRRAAAGPPAPARRPNRFADDPDALRFAGLLPDGHRLVSAAHATAERWKAEDEAKRTAAEARAARARAKADAEALAAAGGKPGGGAQGRPGGDARAERRRSDQAAALSVLHSRSHPSVDLLPYWMADVEEAWRATVHTRLPAEGLFGGALMLGEPLPPYEVPSEAARLRLEQEEFAALAARQASSVTSHAGGSFINSGRSVPNSPSRSGPSAPPPWADKASDASKAHLSHSVSRFGSRSLPSAGGSAQLPSTPGAGVSESGAGAEPGAAAGQSQAGAAAAHPPSRLGRGGAAGGGGGSGSTTASGGVGS